MFFKKPKFETADPKKSYNNWQKHQAKIKSMKKADIKKYKRRDIFRINDFLKSGVGGANTQYPSVARFFRLRGFRIEVKNNKLWICAPGLTVNGSHWAEGRLIPK